ncbi:hypothetical protein D3C85_267010 [compost metagenome]
MVRSSPRANAGLSRLAASFWPACPPAPIMVWASSMNRMMGDGLFFTSSITFFSRFSNSPLTLAPACNRPMSSTRNVTSASAGGTSPATMRSARPSTTAVLPTPASPVRMGLFCRRRVRMSIIWRISASRPITGSILPSRARSVRFAVYWSSAGDGDKAGAGWPSSPCDGAPSAKPTACPASSEPSVSAAKSCFNASRRNDSNSVEPRRANCARSGSVSKASSRCPDRMRVVCVSSEAISQACSNSLGRWAENTGVRVLPFLKRPISAFRSASSASVWMWQRRAMMVTSLAGFSSNARNRCSRSTS